MRTDAYICDGCGKVKGETNHWFGVKLHQGLGTITIISFNKIPEELMTEYEHVCGLGCLMKRVDAMAVAL